MELQELSFSADSQGKGATTADMCAKLAEVCAAGVPKPSLLPSSSAAAAIAVSSSAVQNRLFWAASPAVGGPVTPTSSSTVSPDVHVVGAVPHPTQDSSLNTSSALSISPLASQNSAKIAQDVLSCLSPMPMSPATWNRTPGTTATTPSRFLSPAKKKKHLGIKAESPPEPADLKDFSDVLKPFVVGTTISPTKQVATGTPKSSTKPAAAATPDSPSAVRVRSPLKQLRSTAAGTATPPRPKASANNQENTNPMLSTPGASADTASHHQLKNGQTSPFKPLFSSTPTKLPSTPTSNCKTQKWRAAAEPLLRSPLQPKVAQSPASIHNAMNHVLSPAKINKQVTAFMSPQRNSKPSPLSTSVGSPASCRVALSPALRHIRTTLI
eukprot:CAMPEP_0175158834 /NCGR_PEP_ID=MMETSP0087-20121206/23051_1 /TAXON_ID=136419 /ORGANISM="Unknown Unknown, Strain D1" /LENGTH=382 /DNA_ID=CAMNT_0016446745 /DNA_START=28 /DNA_END=1176 /DNA_ORIENTATION=+